MGEPYLSGTVCLAPTKPSDRMSDIERGEEVIQNEETHPYTHNISNHIDGRLPALADEHSYGHSTTSSRKSQPDKHTGSPNKHSHRDANTNTNNDACVTT